MVPIIEGIIRQEGRQAVNIVFDCFEGVLVKIDFSASSQTRQKA